MSCPISKTLANARGWRQSGPDRKNRLESRRLACVGRLLRTGLQAIFCLFGMQKTKARA